MAGGPSQISGTEHLKPLYCNKCSFYKKMDREYIDVVNNLIAKREPFGIDNKQSITIPPHKMTPQQVTDEIIKPLKAKQYTYHISWAVFKHLPDSVPYRDSVLAAHHFCIFKNPPCTRIYCRMAVHCIAALFPQKIALFLLTHYTPITEERRASLLDLHNFDFTYNYHHLYDLMRCSLRSEDIDKYHPLDSIELVRPKCGADITLLSSVVSAFGECYLTDFVLPNDERLYPSFLSLFELKDKDCILNIDRLECIFASRSQVITSNFTTVNKIVDKKRLAEITQQIEMLLFRHARMEGLQRFHAPKVLKSPTPSACVSPTCSSSPSFVISDDGDGDGGDDGDFGDIEDAADDGDDEDEVYLHEENIIEKINQSPAVKEHAKNL